MRLLILVVALAAISPAAAYATCKEEVAAAFEKQRKMSGFRMETNMVSEDGPIKMTVDYLLPDRMRQKVTNQTTQKETETVLVGQKAWTTQGQGWTELPPEAVAEISEQVKSTVVDPPKEMAEYGCAGKMTFQGKEYFAYKADASGDKKKKATDTSDASGPVRYFYVDPTTGLPEASVFALPGREDKPFFKTIYSYPVDLKIEAPDVK
jgi:hypothetical protein